MGSIVGGLYAAGYTDRDLDSIVHTLDWSFLLSDEIQRQNLLISEKQDISLIEFGNLSDNFWGLLKSCQKSSLLFLQFMEALRQVIQYLFNIVSLWVALPK